MPPERIDATGVQLGRLKPAGQVLGSVTRDWLITAVAIIRQSLRCCCHVHVAEVSVTRLGHGER